MQFHVNGFHVDKIDNNHTEDKRAVYNSTNPPILVTNPPILVSKDCVTYLTSYVYHVTKILSNHTKCLAWYCTNFILQYIN